MSTTKEDSKKTESAKLKEDDEGMEATATSTPVTVKVGDAVYKTTKETLLGRDEDSFFHLQLSGRWKQQGNNVLDINGRCGETFVDVLYYMRFGDIPRDPATRKPLPSVEQLAKLEAEAKFYLLPGLEKLCTVDSTPPLFVVTEFHCDSSKEPHVTATQFSSYETARAFFDDQTRGMVQEPYQVEQGDYYTDTRSVDNKTGLEELEIWCDGNWKRPYGYALKIWHNNDPTIYDFSKEERRHIEGACMQHKIRAWPDVYDY